MYVTLLESAEQRVEHALATGRHAWVHVARGSLSVNGQTLKAGDGAAISGEPKIEIAGAPSGEALLFDSRMKPGQRVATKKEAKKNSKDLDEINLGRPV